MINKVVKINTKNSNAKHVMCINDASSGIVKEGEVYTILRDKYFDDDTYYVDLLIKGEVFTGVFAARFIPYTDTLGDFE